MNLMISNQDGDTTAQVAMTLAAIAYAQGNDIPTLLAESNLATQGRWQMQWLGTDDANQAYIARDSVTGQFAICIRGSATDPFTEKFWLDWIEQDLSVFEMVSWPYGGAPSDAKISSGTLNSLQSLLSLSSNSGQTIVDFLQENLQPNSPLTGVVGHSLGGAMAEVFAAYLHQQFSQNELDYWPVTFAAPTTGNTIFANWLESKFVASVSRYHNTLDVVPHAWGDLDWIANSFPNGGPKIRSDIATFIMRIQMVLNTLGDNYVQPGPGIRLQNLIQQNDDWFIEAGYQHSGMTYLSLVGAPSLPARVFIDPRLGVEEPVVIQPV